MPTHNTAQTLYLYKHNVPPMHIHTYLWVLDHMIGLQLNRKGHAQFWCKWCHWRQSTRSQDDRATDRQIRKRLVEYKTGRKKAMDSMGDDPWHDGLATYHW